jgi:hypothetical protein
MPNQEITMPCACSARFIAAIAEVKAKATQHPHIADTYLQTALELRRIENVHFGNCSQCQRAAAQDSAVAA